MLELLGQTSRHEVIQRHVKKLFAGIYTLELTDENKAIAMLSQQEEKVPFNEPVNLTSRPEEWLSVLENQMRSTLQSLVNRCLIDMDKGSSDPLHYPSQVLSLAESIVFVEKCEQAIVRGTLTNLLSSLKVYLFILSIFIHYYLLLTLSNIKKLIILEKYFYDILYYSCFDALKVIFLIMTCFWVYLL